jgi:4-carboxymuconolactone decarboxylase
MGGRYVLTMADINPTPDPELRARALEIWREFWGFDAPPITDPYLQFTTDHLFGRVWARPGLARRDRRLVTLTAVAIAGQRDPLKGHLAAAVRSGDLSLTELHEWVVHLAHYAGWPVSATAYAVLREVESEAEPPQ